MQAHQSQRPKPGKEETRQNHTGRSNGKERQPTSGVEVGLNMRLQDGSDLLSPYRFEGLVRIPHIPAYPHEEHHSEDHSGRQDLDWEAILHQTLLHSQARAEDSHRRLDVSLSTELGSVC